jgi:multisubunit Na+/H+ antiporter MnhG subunit
MVDASKSLGILLVIVGTILFFVVCGEFIVRMIMAIGCLYLINWGLQLQGSGPLPMKVGMWTNRMWDSSSRDDR